MVLSSEENLVKIFITPIFTPGLLIQSWDPLVMSAQNPLPGEVGMNKLSVFRVDAHHLVVTPSRLIMKVLFAHIDMLKE